MCIDLNRVGSQVVDSCCARALSHRRTPAPAVTQSTPLALGSGLDDVRSKCCIGTIEHSSRSEARDGVHGTFDTGSGCSLPKRDEGVVTTSSADWRVDLKIDIVDRTADGMREYSDNTDVPAVSAVITVRPAAFAVEGDIAQDMTESL